MSSVAVQHNNKQVMATSGRKFKECVTKSLGAAEEKKAMENWIKRFDELFLALCKSEQLDENAQKLKKHQIERKSDKEFSVKLNTKDYIPCNVELVVDTNNKLLVKGRREIQTEEEIYYEEFNDEIDLPQNIDDDEISLTQDDNGYLIIKAPILVDEKLINKAQICETEKKTGNDAVVSKPKKSNCQHWNPLYDELFIPLVKSIDRKDQLEKNDHL